MAVGRTRQHSGADIWPGFVDALAALLIIVIFLLMVFTLAQYFLSEILSGRDRALDRLNREIAQLTEMLSLEEAEKAELESTLSQIQLQLGTLSAERDRLSSQLAALLPERDRLSDEVAALTAERDALKVTAEKSAAALEDAYKTIGADREKIELQLRSIVSLERDIAALREVRDTLEKRVAELDDTLRAQSQEVAALKGSLEERTREAGALKGSLEERTREAGALRDRSKELAAELASAEERTRLAQREIDARDVRLRDLGARVTQTEEALGAEQAVSREAQEQVRLLNLQIAALRQQLARIEAALEASELEAEAKGIQIVNLSQRLNAALASKVQELASFRSEFFGRLKQALGDRRDVRIVGDRFVFQSEVLFPSGQATLQPGGRDQIDKLARTITEISAKIPTEINWVLRVDGHTDRIPISTPAYPSNWELSTGRAVAVVKYLIDQGVPAARLAATGFGEFQPIDPGSTVAAFRRNRRIEFKLTQR
ncbi:MAG: peptidoglycan -binding protein [Defluviicoccus sp.]|nr:peptidoglycan -binding protein [Defluviicoccus sp.]